MTERTLSGSFKSVYDKDPILNNMNKVTASIFFILFSIQFSSVFGQSPDYTEYNLILNKYVSPQIKSGIPVNWVDYTALSKDISFNKIVKTIEAFPVDQLDGEAETLSFYINAYNIFAIKMVIDHWPLKSIKDAGSWLKPVWDKPVGMINGKEVTLGMIEHEILRPMGEPRIHLAIVCASLSCPDLRPEAYRADVLHEQLQEQAIQFLKNQAKGLKVDNSVIHVSKIFDWFEEDFSSYGGVASFIHGLIDIPSDLSIKTDIEYNWSLNGQ